MMNNLFSINDENGNQNVTIESSLNETGPLSKKRKLSIGEISSSNIEIKLLQSAILEWKQYAQKLEAEKLQHIDKCNQDKILELEDTVKNLQSVNAKNNEEKRQHQAQMDSLNSAIEEHIKKIKTLDDEKRKFESKIEELADEISTMKNIKSEIKDAVESERENVHNVTAKLKAEINELKNRNDMLNENNQKLLDKHAKEIKSLKEQKDAAEKKQKESLQSEQKLKEEKMKFEIETKKLKSEVNLLKKQKSVLEKKALEFQSQRSAYKEDQKEFREKTAKNQQLEQKCKDLEEKINKNKKEFESIIDGLNADNQNLSKTNMDFMNNKKVLQNSITELKNKAGKMEKSVRESESQRSAYEKQNKEDQKKLGEITAKTEQLEQKCKDLEETINKNMKEFQPKIDELKADNQNLSKTNASLINKEKLLQNYITELEKKIKKKEQHGLEKIASLNEIVSGAKLKTTLLSCKSNIVANVAKLVGNASEPWELYSSNDSSKKPFLLTEEEMIRNCFKMNINGHLVVNKGPKIHHIMNKINTCELTHLEIHSEIIDCTDYVKLTSSKTIQICILEYVTFKSKDGKCGECSVVELLTYLPNIKEFKYRSGMRKDHSLLAKDLGQLEQFPNLRKFEIFNLSESFKFEDLEQFIKKNDKNVSYSFSFYGRLFKRKQKQIEAAKNELLKSLSFPCKIHQIVWC